MLLRRGKQAPPIRLVGRRNSPVAQVWSSSLASLAFRVGCLLAERAASTVRLQHVLDGANRGGTTAAFRGRAALERQEVRSRQPQILQGRASPAPLARLATGLERELPVCKRGSQTWAGAPVCACPWRPSAATPGGDQRAHAFNSADAALARERVPSALTGLRAGDLIDSGHT